MQIAELLCEATNDLATESPRLDAEVLLGHVLNRTRAYLYGHGDRELGEELVSQYRALIKSRQQHIPIAYLTGEKEFWSLTLEVSPDTLLPRPDTECLVEFCLQLDLPDTANVLDLGTGTGAIALALATERPSWCVVGTDIVSAAVDLAVRNALRHRITNTTFFRSDWYSALEGRTFQLIVSNPPYIEPSDHHLQQGDVQHEPRSALVAESNGLAGIRKIAASAPRFLSDKGVLCVEHGYQQGDAVQEIFRQAGLIEVATGQDYGGQDRYTFGVKNIE